MSTPAPNRRRRNPLAALWRSAPGQLWLLAAGALVAAVAANPLVLDLTRIFPFGNDRPKSGLWVLSAIAFVLGAGLLLSRKRVWAAKLVLLVVVLAAGLLLVETGLRIWPPYEVSGVRAWKLAGYDENAWGFADTEPRFDATNRIMVLGDSITYGLGDGLDQTTRFHDVLEQELTTAGYDVDVQSLGIADTQLDTYLESYRLRAPMYDPQVVVVSWCLNDLDYGAYDRSPKEVTSESSATGALRDLLRGFAKSTKVNECFLATVMANRLSIFARERGWIEADWLDEHNRRYQENLAESYADQPRVEQARADLRWLADDCRAKGRHLVVLVWPFEFNITNQRRDELDVIRGVLADEGIAAIDVYDEYVDAAAKEIIYSFKDACHPNREGHRIAGEVLLGAVRPLVR